MNYKKVSTQLISSIRRNFGKSQNYFNLKMGFKHNQLYKWESGALQISWKDFLSFCSLANIDIQKALLDVYRIDMQPQNYYELINHIVKSGKKNTDFDKLNISNYRLSKWQTRDSIPSLSDMLQIFHYFSFCLIEFLDQITDINQIKEVANEYVNYQRNTDLHRKLPFAGAVLHALELEQYLSLPRHEEGLISKFLGISIVEERQALQLLEELNFIKKEGQKYRAQSQFLDFRNDLESFKATRMHWLKKAQEIVISSSSKDANLGYLCFSVSPQSYQKILPLYSQFFSEVRKVCAEDRLPAQKVGVVAVQLFEPKDVL